MTIAQGCGWALMASLYVALTVCMVLKNGWLDAALAWAFALSLTGVIWLVFG